MTSIVLTSQRRLPQHVQSLQQSVQRLPPTEPLSDRVSEEQIQFYLKLVLYSTISHFKAGHSERDVSINIPREHSDLRRDFLDQLSYLCDIEKSGATVTAAAMQRESRGFNESSVR